MRSFIFFFCLIIALPGLAREVYKWTAEDGVPIYSDTYRPGAQKLSVSTGKAQRSLQAQTTEPTTETEGTANTGDYQTFEIAQPNDDETIRSDEGVVNVGLSLSPMLSPGHVIQVYLDGSKLSADLSTTQFSLNELNRGTHSLQAKVVDAESNPLISTAVVNFHLRQAAVENP